MGTCSCCDKLLSDSSAAQAEQQRISTRTGRIQQTRRGTVAVVKVACLVSRRLRARPRSGVTSVN